MAAASPARRLPGGTWAEVEALQHHWEALDDDRKTLFAQMAVLTRCAGDIGHRRHCITPRQCMAICGNVWRSKNDGWCCYPPHSLLRN